jgi:hypothetical protein
MQSFELDHFGLLLIEECLSAKDESLCSIITYHQ